MTRDEVLAELQKLGTASIKKVLCNHGAAEPIYGVKISDLKKIQKRVKTDHRLALELFDTGVYDAMYLAGLIADDAAMGKKDLRGWLAKAKSPAIAEYTVPWVAAGGPHGRALALEWIDSKKDSVAVAGWATLCGLVGVTADADLDVDELTRLLERVRKSIHDEPDRVRYWMNAFVIAVGCYVKPLTATAVRVAKDIGKVTVDMGDTACKVPAAVEYIDKVRKRGAIGKKRSSAKC